jgi:hypothetical protein
VAAGLSVLAAESLFNLEMVIVSVCPNHSAPLFFF